MPWKPCYEKGYKILPGDPMLNIAAQYEFQNATYKEIDVRINRN